MYNYTSLLDDVTVLSNCTCDHILVLSLYDSLRFLLHQGSVISALENCPHFTTSLYVYNNHTARTETNIQLDICLYPDP